MCVCVFTQGKLVGETLLPHSTPSNAVVLLYIPSKRVFSSRIQYITYSDLDFLSVLDREYRLIVLLHSLMY